MFNSPFRLKQLLAIAGCLALATACSTATTQPRISVVTVPAGPTPQPGLREFELRGKVSGPLPATVEVENSPYRTQTDKTGQFQLSGLPPETAYLHIYSSEANGQRHALRVPVTASQARVELPPLQLSPTGSIVGNVSGAEALAGTAVFIPGTPWVALTDAQGDFFLGPLPAGAYTVMAQHPEHVLAQSQVQVESGQAAPLVLTLGEKRKMGLSLSGQILHRGLPLAGVTVALLGQPHMALSDEKGQFRLSGVSPGSYSLWLKKEGFAPQTHPLSLQASLQDLRWELQADQAEGKIQGQALDRQGQPLSGAQISLEPGSLSAQSDAQGRFGLSVRPGAYLLKAKRQGQIQASGFVSVDPGQTVNVSLEGVLNLNSLLCQQENSNQITVHAPGSQVTINVENRNHCVINPG